MMGFDSGDAAAKTIDCRAQSLSLAYEDHEVIHELSLSIPARQITALVGPNGSGKSTLLKGLARLMKPTCGAVYLDSQAIHRLPTKEVARRLAMLPQRPEAPDGLTVRELVSFGRFPHQGFFGISTAEDDAKIDQALEITGIAPLADQSLGELSGGQRQLAWVALALAQDTRLLLLDEPTTFLDMSHQIEVLDVLQRLNQEHGRTIVMVLHDLNLAARYSSHMVILGGGKVLYQGAPWDIMRPDILAAAFGVAATILRDPQSGAPICVPHGRRPPRDVQC
jgi:iron complex transport system ATP-binding protein